MSSLWTPEDVEMLSSLSGDLPWPMVPAVFNRFRPHRTATALRRKADGLGLLRRSVGQFITAGAIVGIAGINYERIRRWILSRELKARRYGEGSAFPYYISRKDLRAFARKHPEQFGGLSQSELLQLFDSEKLAEEIAAMELPRLSQKVPVMCVETGKRFESIQAAAKAAYVTPTRLQTVLRDGTTANGLRYRRVVAMTQQGRAA
jgi:hypothetical protein